jgi:hypothetical protein
VCNKSCCVNCQNLKKLQCYKHRKFMFTKIQFFFYVLFFLESCQEKYRAYDMPCCVHFTGYNQQLKFLVHYSSFLRSVSIVARIKFCENSREKLKNNSMCTKQEATFETFFCYFLAVILKLCCEGRNIDIYCVIMSVVCCLCMYSA